MQGFDGNGVECQGLGVSHVVSFLIRKSAGDGRERQVAGGGKSEIVPCRVMVIIGRKEGKEEEEKLMSEAGTVELQWSGNPK